MKKSHIIPQYVRDLDDGTFAEVVEDNGHECFAYFINMKTGKANATVGSVQFTKGDGTVEMLDDTLCGMLHDKIALIQKKIIKDMYAKK